MLPCCGFFYIPDDELENVTISGCDFGTDWTVRHEGDRVILETEDGASESVPIVAYRSTVFSFADKGEAIYRSCSPRKISGDAFTQNGVTAFWNEWHRRRNA